MKVTHKLVVTEPAGEVQEKLRKALTAAGARELVTEGESLRAEVFSGRSLVIVEIDSETTVHGTQLTFRTRDQGAWSQPARKVMREVQDQFWGRAGKHSRTGSSRRGRRLRQLLQAWKQPLLIAGLVLLAGAAVYLLWFQ